MIVAIGLAATIGLAVWLSYALLPMSPAQPAGSFIVTIPDGATSADIGKILADRGLLRSSQAFDLVSRLWGLDRQLQAGDYRFSPAMNAFEMVQQLQKGKVATFLVTIPEGTPARQVADLLAAKGIVDRDRFIRLVQDDTQVYGLHSPLVKPVRSVEGYLFPDTYKFVRGRPEEEVVKRLVDRFVQKALPTLERVAKHSDLTVHQLVTLASIVEEEALRDSERSIIAGVFYNRLRRNMPLQSDPTVKYALDNPPVRLLYRHLEVDSPYNTYKVTGLPPGPITNPGMASLQAAMHPAPVDYLYFVARGDGTHAFARTFKGHILNRRRLGY